MTSICFRLVSIWLLSVMAAPLCAQTAGEPDIPEVAESLPEHLRYFYDSYGEVAADGPAPAQGVYAGERTWVAGDQLKVCFFGGSSHVKKIISLVASEWSTWGNISFDFGQEPQWRDCRSSKSGFSQIRIGFTELGYWSSVGTDSDVLLNAKQPSMNLRGFDKRYMEVPTTTVTNENLHQFVRERDRGTILHEFGHALGLLHEAQNPAMKCLDEIRFDGPDGAYVYYAAAPNYWDREKTDRNLGPAYLVDEDTVAEAPDAKSNMMYSLPAKILFKGTASPCYVGENNVLSAGDKRLIAKLYPRDAPVLTDNDRKNAPAPMGVPMSVAGSADYLERIRLDLQSPVTTTRREARRQLAAALQTIDGNGFVKLVDELSDSSYRARLGMVEAIRRAPSLPELSVEQRKEVSGVLKKTIEEEDNKTFRASAEKATQRIDLKPRITR